MKSGTNWLGSLLSSHQTISVVGEFHWQNIAAPLFNNFEHQPIYNDQAYREFVHKRFENMVRQGVLRKGDKDATLVGERTPHSILPIVLRDAPHIIIERDGRDVLVSRAYHLYNMPGVHRLFKRIPAMARDLERFQGNPWYFQKNPEQLLRHEVMVRESVTWWRDHLISDRAAMQQNTHMKFHTVKYEELHANVEVERTRLFEFLGVDPSQAAKIEGHLKPGFEKERPTEFLRKGAVGDWKNYFTDQTKEWFKDVAGKELIDFGFEESNDW